MAKILEKEQKLGKHKKSVSHKNFSKREKKRKDSQKKSEKTKRRESKKTCNAYSFRNTKEAITETATNVVEKEVNSEDSELGRNRNSEVKETMGEIRRKHMSEEDALKEELEIYK